MKPIIFTTIVLLTGLLFFAGKGKEDGKRLFIANCTACHRAEIPAVGPPFQHIRKDYGFAWTAAFVRNGDSLWQSRDLRAAYICEVYDRTLPHKIPLTDEELKAILDYVDSVPVKDVSFYHHRRLSGKQLQQAIDRIDNDRRDIDARMKTLDSLKRK